MAPRLPRSPALFAQRATVRHSSTEMAKEINTIHETEKVCYNRDGSSLWNGLRVPPSSSSNLFRERRCRRVVRYHRFQGGLLFTGSNAARHDRWAISAPGPGAGDAAKHDRRVNLQQHTDWDAAIGPEQCEGVFNCGPRVRRRSGESICVPNSGGINDEHASGDLYRYFRLRDHDDFE